VRAAANAKTIQLQVLLDVDAPPLVADPNRLQQVIWNLLSNAIKYTPSGGRVRVLLEHTAYKLEVSVNDTGEGIDPSFLPHVFERFRQSDGSTTRRHGGLGLGLAITQHLVELHGGTICAASEGRGRGSTFSVSLPLQHQRSSGHAAEPAPAEQEHAPTSVAPADFDLDGIKVLVVDDELDARELLRQILEEHGAAVLTAASTAEALAIAEATSLGLLISDLGMPTADGYDLIRKIRALPPECGGCVPAIALTAYARSEDRTQALIAGFQMHLAKPVESKELLATVASLAGRAGTIKAFAAAQ
jgi:CheY-like chemotaxis protein